MRIEKSQAGEVIISSIMYDGMFDGPDYELLDIIDTRYFNSCNLLRRYKKYSRCKKNF